MRHQLEPDVAAELMQRIERIEQGERPEAFTNADWVFMWVVTAVVVFLFVALSLNLLLHR